MFHAHNASVYKGFTGFYIYSRKITLANTCRGYGPEKQLDHVRHGPDLITGELTAGHKTPTNLVGR